MKPMNNKLRLKITIGLLALISFGALAQTNRVSQLSHYSGPSVYQQSVARLMLAEVNDYSAGLNLPESIPIGINSLTETFVSSPYLAERFGVLGSMATTNFAYGFGKGKHLCYITKKIKGTNPSDPELNKPYAIAPSAVNTNAAYLLAKDFLTRAYVDVSRLSTSSVVSVEPWIILKMTTSKYTVEWQRNGKPVVKVVLASPQNELWTLRVEDPSLILRPSLQITNLDYLLSQTNAPASANSAVQK